VNHAAELRALLDRPEIIACPIVYNPLSARIAKSVSFEMLGVGGYALGANLMIPEPLLTLTECVEHARSIVAAVELPVVVDAGAGFGSPVHVQRTVREFERVGVAGIHLEDQVYPKRVHYHKGIEHIVPASEMADKIAAAVDARHSAYFVLVARTDAMATDGYDEAIRRANLYVEAGADLVLCWPNTLEEAKAAPRDIAAPTVYGVSEGNRLGRPRSSVSELEDMGYKVVRNPHLATLAQYQAVRTALRQWHDTGQSSDAPEEMVRTRKEIEDLLGLDALYDLESATVERRT
jgi:2-methylisocitrate lyase-like PEP mutase family enzyme